MVSRPVCLPVLAKLVVTEHVAAFNVAVRYGEWTAFADRFAPDATMAFAGAPAPGWRNEAAGNRWLWPGQSWIRPSMRA